MEERAFRLDFLIAIAALLVSVVTTAALLYQTRVIHDEYAAALWPYLSVDSTFGWGYASGMEIDVNNDGFGPALIQSAQLSVDGKAVSGWSAFGEALQSDPIVKRLHPGAHSISSVASVNGGAIIRAGATKTLLKVTAPADVPEKLFRNHQIALDFCYCSLNDSCWTLHATPGSERNTRPVPVRACRAEATISS